MPAPTDLEQLFLELINDARLDPLGNASRYITSYSPLVSSDSAIQAAIDYFNVSGSALLSAYQGLTAVAPVAWNSNLATAAENHSAAMIAADEQSHQVAGEASFGDRLTAAGYNYSFAGENVYAYAENALYGHAGFMIDWGSGPNGMQSPAGHRINIMHPDFSEVGIDVTEESNAATDVGPLVVTQDFGDRGLTFVLGVAYTDSDNNDFYSVGEGRGDLTVQWGSSSTTTAASGGYSLGITAGLRTITLTGGGLSGAVTVTTTIQSDNIKLDVVDGNTLLTSTSVQVDGAISVIRGIGTLYGGLTLTAGSGNQQVIGTAGSDTLGGGSGNDDLIGDAGNDTIDGGTGNDTISGGAGNDTIVGGDGDDTIDGGAGNDTINGGTGSDVVTYSGNQSQYTITIHSAGSATVTGSSSGTDTLSGIEILRFADGDVIVDPNQGNTAPTVQASQSVSTNEDTAKQVTVAGSDEDGDTLSYSAGSASHGSVTGGSGGVFTYTPNANYNGSDSFVVTVSDGKGGTANQTVNVTVTAVNDAPTVQASQTVFTNEDVPRQITVAASDVEGDTLSYSAGSASHGSVTGGSGGSFTYTPNANYNGTDSFVVTVSDGNGGTTNQTVNITIASVNDAPTVQASQSVSTNEDTAKQVTVSGSDVEGDTLTYTAGSASHGSVTGGSGGSFTYTPNANYNGSDSFVVTVSDGKGGTANQTVNVTVTAVNDAPTVAASQSIFAEGGVAKTVTVSGSDVDGDSLSYSAGSASHGNVTGGSGGVFTYTPSDSYNGSDSFVVTVSDGNGGSATHTVNVTVTPPNHAPTVQASQSVSANEDTAKLVSVSGNDVDGDALTYSAGSASHGSVTGGSGGSFTYTPNANYNGSDSFVVTVSDGRGGTATQTVNVSVTPINDTPTVAATQDVWTSEDTAKEVTVAGSDVDGDILNYSAGSASHGSVTGGSGGVFTYTPNADYLGADSFVVTVSDGKGGTATQTVSVMVTPPNEAPTVQASQGVTTSEDTAKQVTVAGSDADGDTLTYSAASASHGTVTGGFGGHFTYTPSADYNGSDSFVVTVSDGKGGTATQTVNVTVTAVNDAPTVAASQSVITSQDTAEAVVVAGSDTDGDVLTYSAGSASHGTVTGGSGGQFSYMPDTGYIGSDSFVVTVSDGKGGSATQSVNISVTAVNGALGVSASQNVVTNEDTAKLVRVAGPGVDGDTQTFSAGSASHGSVTGGSGGVFVYGPDADFSGTDSFVITVSDGKGGKATQIVNVTVAAVNDAPAVVASVNVWTDAGEATQVAVAASDARATC
ncbi:MAG: tandem-95 repeat protein [Novosphingobium sp.]